MREHQIVITLKPEQFLEVQRLARAAGSKSMGMFVRQKLLAVLGIDGAAAKDKMSPGGQDLGRLTGELRKLHAELRTFVTESLPNSYGLDRSAERADGGIRQSGQRETAADAGGETSLEAALAAFEEAEDELEELAEREFAISPRLGAIETTANRTGGPSQADEMDGLDDLLKDTRMKRFDAFVARSVKESLPSVDEVLKSGADTDDLEDEMFEIPLSLPSPGKGTSQPLPAGAPAESASVAAGGAASKDAVNRGSADAAVTDGTAKSHPALAPEGTAPSASPDVPAGAASALPEVLPDTSSSPPDPSKRQLPRGPRPFSGGPPPKRR